MKMIENDQENRENNGKMKIVKRSRMKMMECEENDKKKNKET